mgnify:CR=1 FL=1
MGGVRCLGLFPKKNRFFFGLPYAHASEEGWGSGVGRGTGMETSEQDSHMRVRRREKEGGGVRRKEGHGGGGRWRENNVDSIEDDTERERVEQFTLATPR